MMVGINAGFILQRFQVTVNKFQIAKDKSQTNHNDQNSKSQSIGF
ncbi:hypothetical protein D1AOALGA4SA_6938 [Olavius algarvensis Delta 1 endosymbiont]|nr:hypothetical protein D1AOALGA4SA_6938 [Olavius algarvensis Delta 1 endosymbiont]